MAHMDDGFTAFEHMDDKGRRALHVAGALWERLYRDAVDRAEKAEWLCDRMEKWSQDWGLNFDIKEATKHWNNRFRREPPALVPWYEARITKRSEEMRKLRDEVECAQEAEQRATAWPQRERNRAEGAEAECNALMAEIERMRSARPKQDRY